MADPNTTAFTNPSTFILLGIRGLEMSHVWIATLFCILYFIAILVNFAILYIVKTEPSLHEPVYYFLCMLAVTDLVLSTSTIPQILANFWFSSREISFSACLTQMFFIHGFSVIESGIFVAMALDRYWPYCKTNIIISTQCEHMAVVKLACGNTLISSYYGLFVLSCRIGLDVFFIILSYIQILRAIFRLPTKEAQLKTFRTCSSHICLILAFYFPAIFGSLASRLGSNLSSHFHVFISSVYLLVPPILNPIIYGVMTKQIRDRLLRLFTPKVTKVFSSHTAACHTELPGVLASDMVLFPGTLTGQSKKL
ncbi:olfactory receptor 52E2-like [Pelodiscus sinensis]|uniref:olfactory receptor 52E2-like n=1 Tax=Pelodiscus sinensis TaxID=13735 RepID=UPI0007044558